MEVEPHVLDVLVADSLEDSGHLLPYAVLAALFVNQVDPVLSLIVSLGLLDMPLRCLQTLIKVGVRSDGRRPRHIGLHLPDQGDRASDLQVACNLEASILLFVGNDVLGLAEIGSVALFVKTTHDESATHSPRVLP